MAVRAASDDVNKKLQESLESTTEYLSKTWEKTEDKPAAVAVTGAAILLLITASSIVDTIVSARVMVPWSHRGGVSVQSVGSHARPFNAPGHAMGPCSAYHEQITTAGMSAYIPPSA